MAFHGKGTTVSFDGGALAEVVSIQPPGITNETVDVTPLGGTARVFLAGIPDHGECVLVLYGDDGVRSAIRAKAASGAESEAVITFADDSATTATFDCFVTGFSPEVMDTGSAATISVTLKVTGAVTWA